MQFDPGPRDNRGDHQGLWLLGLALLLTLVFHGGLLFSQSFVRTYDALIHVFFASHYAQQWFDPWETRWYTGFLTVSYPPLSHQLIALLSFVFGLKNAFAIVQLFALLNLTLGVYRFSLLFVSTRSAGFAALILTLSSSITETVHVFGQLPTTLSLSFLLNAIPFAVTFVRHGQWRDLFRAVAFVATTTAGHHVTTLFGTVFFVVPTLVVAVLEDWNIARPNESAVRSAFGFAKRQLLRLYTRLIRTGLFGALTVAALVVVVFPYWMWSRADPISQVSIPHASRDNFFVNTAAGLMFFLVPWASVGIFLPYALYKGFSTWRFPIALSLAALAFLGTGGTTPLPKLLLRSAFDILTLDRFTFWATILILPFAGLMVESVLFGRGRDYIDANLGKRVRLIGIGVTCVVLVCMTIAVATLTRYRKFQPEPIDVAPIVNFLEKDEHWRYRYLTLGFGDQMAWLSANTNATTPDGNYHSARRLIELTTTPVERLDGAKYTGVPGLGSLEQFVTTPERYNLKFIISNDTFYDPLLFFSGWHRLGRLENGVMVWEREDIPPLPERLPKKTIPLYQSIMWGVFPMLTTLLALFSLLLTRIPFHPRPMPEDQLLSVSQLIFGKYKFLNFRLDLTRHRLHSRLRRTLFLTFAVVLLGFGLYRQWQPPNSPEQVALSYWEDMDFKRFRESFRWLLPASGLTLDRYLLDLSVQGGLFSGYAKLDTIKPTVVAQDGNLLSPQIGNKALVKTKLVWVTALGVYTNTVAQNMEFTAQGWKIQVSALIKPRPQNRFQEEAGLQYYRSPRRLTTGVTAAGDILDRPILQIRKSRLIQRGHLPNDPMQFAADGKPVKPNNNRLVYSIVGEIKNIDARPADVTVTGVLRDAQNIELARNNVGLYMQHKLLPGEYTPFRIDFTGPDAPKNPEAVTDYELFAKAVVTQYDLHRPLLTLIKPNLQTLQGHVVNVGTVEAAIPRMLFGINDRRGVAWVDEMVLPTSISAREQTPFTKNLTLPPRYKVRIHQGLAEIESSKSITDQAVELGPLTARLKNKTFESYWVVLQAFNISK